MYSFKDLSLALNRILRFFSVGILTILVICLVSTVIVALLPFDERKGIEFWVITSKPLRVYEKLISGWNEEHPEKPFVMRSLNNSAMERRMLAGFLSGVPMADILEPNDGLYPKAFLGPVEQVGFLDLTGRLHAEGLYAQFNEPSFAQMTSRGRIFGLPHDVHPVLLGYRADLVEAAGIDVSEIETWDDYFRVMRPLMVDLDGDGRPDRYLLNISELAMHDIVVLLLQNDGQIFDEDDVPVFASERNAWTLAKIITWVAGPDRVAVEVSRESAGHRQHLEGYMVGSLLPDWLFGAWKNENPQLAGKLKLMPLPAFEKGGRRTSVRGGTMIGINKRSAYIEECWEVAKRLYTSAEIAETRWREETIISPYKAHWAEPFYHEPDPFCGGQRTGTLYIEQAPYLPIRPSSPYTDNAKAAISAAAIALRAYAERHEVYDADTLAPEALRLLQHEQDTLKRLISRNVLY
ncbi:hypothetical protein AXK11_05335 [Cephaloticoccus primus]|uniref:Sugar ABC transporter substrate-binding protein n=1 Tax=Cephaloticoccus primus TaxID=1548207 RepID=A0A139SN21_9BACT|nr:extracellular solute-binding protein [Cephaloticoccus primus]KXU35945.1 hypothetical protein AXK11_05335 [Cephaloticoccus primus]